MKKRFSRFTSLILALVLMLSVLVGCQGETEEIEEEEPAEEVELEETGEEEEEEEEIVIDMNRDARGENGVVAAARPEASEVGVEIMKQGGNAIDAAVATAFALGVVEPNASGIGGGGFMMVRFAETGEEVFLDFRETAPGNATDDMYELDEEGNVLNEEKTVGPKSSAVPGEVAGLLTALEEYGTMTREEVMQPAIDLAENGFEVTHYFEQMITEKFGVLNRFESTMEIYFEDGLPRKAGTIIKNPDLAETLRIIAEEGRDGFYKGEVAEDIIKTSDEYGGILTLEDLENYEIEVREPVRGTYRDDYEIISSPPPSSGGTHIVQILNILENFDMKEKGLNTADSLHLWSEAAKLAFADRGEYMADTDFIGDVPLEGLSSKEYAKFLVDEKIDLEKAAEDVEPNDPTQYESESTTHYSVMDKEGNMVAVTKTINYWFASGLVVDGRGFILNNEMDDFNAEPGTLNSIEPGKRPLSSMSPTFVLKDGEPFLTLGSPGATRIIPTVAQVISNIIDHEMDIQEAINAPRMFDMNTGSLALESRIDSDVMEALEEMGHNLDVREELDNYFGGVQCIMMEEDGMIYGAGDPRLDGQAVGY